MGGHIGATWRIRLNLCFLQHTAQMANRSVQPFLHSWQQKVAILYNGQPSPKIVASRWGSGPHRIHDSLSQTEPTVQTASRLVQLFSYRWPQSVPKLYNGTPLSPQNCPFPWGIWAPSNTWFPGPTQVLNPNGILIIISSAVLVGLTSVTDQQTTLLGR